MVKIIAPVEKPNTKYGAVILAPKKKFKSRFLYGAWAYITEIPGFTPCWPPMVGIWHRWACCCPATVDSGELGAAKRGLLSAGYVGVHQQDLGKALEGKSVKTKQTPSPCDRSFSLVPRLFVGMVTVCAAIASSVAVAAASPVTVSTENGPVKGMVVSGLREFSRYPLCGSACGRVALAAAPTSRELEQVARRDHVRQPLSTGYVALWRCKHH